MPVNNSENVVQSALRAGSFILIVAFALSFVVNLLRLTGPLFMLLIYDRVLSSRSEETLISLFILVVAFLSLMGLVDYSRRRILARFAAQFQERVESKIFNSTAKDKFFRRGKDKPASGLPELDSLRGFFHSSGLIAVLDFVWAPMFLLFVFSLHWILGWVALSGLLLLVILTIIKSNFAVGKSERSNDASTNISELRNTMLTSKDVIRSQEMTSSFKARWVTARRSARDKSIELSDWTTWFSILTTQIRMLLQYTVLAVGAYLTLQGQLTVGAMVAATFLVVRVFLPVEQFLKQLPSIKKAIGNWKRLKQILASKNIVQENQDLDDLEPRLSLTSIYTRSPITAHQILKSVNLTIEPGTVVEIIGKSGSGKTVLAETLLGVWPKSAGTILCGGVKIDRLSSQQASDMFGYVPETATLVSGTIEENISGLDVEPNREGMFAAAKLAQLHELIMALPDGYQTSIDDGNHCFSKEQKHRIALARALYNNPKILVIDEPDQSLRTALSNQLAGLVDDFKKRGNSIIVFSRKALELASADHQLLLEDGRIKNIKVVKNVINLEDKKSERKTVRLAKE